ncbi:MAG TPA: crossover junction endodeoxyribonuclease RuvC [Clostridia bacterium]|jgi:crossover junction endodeoxyribonuclease RuvC|nr:crossover junction endodeoxyribonuclease RuvC [Clostridia bacterium]
MIILGIDPGYATVGYGVISLEGSKYKAIDYGVINTPKTDSLPIRLTKISDGIDVLMDKYKPDAVAIEELFFQNNQKTAILVAEARGAILLSLYKKSKNLYEYTPLQIKQAMTGYGRAEKVQIQHMVTLMLGLKEIPKPDDAADALAVALTHAQIGRFSSLFGI